MKTYEEVIQRMAEDKFDDMMGGGQGRIDTGMVPFIFEKDPIEVYIAIDKISDEILKSHRERMASKNV